MQNCQSLSKLLTINDECLNPRTIEKIKVSLPDRIFGESTKNAFYVLCEKPGKEGDIEFFKTYYKLVVSSKCLKVTKTRY